MSVNIVPLTIHTKYPFPVPERTLDLVKHRSTSIHKKYGGEGWKPFLPSPDAAKPLALDCLDYWGMELRAQLKIIDDLLSWGGDITAHMHGLYFALDHLADDFNDLLYHARTSLPYDPVMQRWMAEADASQESLVFNGEQPEDEQESD
jgi:hypothetical protein